MAKRKTEARAKFVMWDVLTGEAAPVGAKMIQARIGDEYIEIVPAVNGIEIRSSGSRAFSLLIRPMVSNYIFVGLDNESD